MIKKITIPLILIGVGFGFYYFAKRKRIFVEEETEKSLSEIYEKVNKKNIQLSEDEVKSKMAELPLEDLKEVNSNMTMLNDARKNFDVVVKDPNSYQSYKDILGLTKRILSRVKLDYILNNY